MLDVALEYIEETMKERVAVLESTYSLRKGLRLAVEMGEHFYTNERLFRQRIKIGFFFA